MFTFKAVPLREEFNYTLFCLVKTAGNTDFFPQYLLSFPESLCFFSQLGLSDHKFIL